MKKGAVCWKGEQKDGNTFQQVAWWHTWVNKTPYLQLIFLFCFFNSFVPSTPHIFFMSRAIFSFHTGFLIFSVIFLCFVWRALLELPKVPPPDWCSQRLSSFWPDRFQLLLEENLVSVSAKCVSVWVLVTLFWIGWACVLEIIIVKEDLYMHRWGMLYEVICGLRRTSGSIKRIKQSQAANGFYIKNMTHWAKG